MDLRFRAGCTQRPLRRLPQDQTAGHHHQRGSRRWCWQQRPGGPGHRLQANNPPDVWQTFPGASIRQYVASGKITDVSSIYREDKLAQVMPKTILKALTQDGRQYGVPTSVHRSNVLWFNKKELSKAGINPPASGYTSDAFIADLAKLKAAGSVPLCLGAKDPFTTAELFENVLLSDLGTQGWDRLTSDRLDWNGQQVRRALSQFSTILDNADPEAGALTWDQATKKLATGGCAFETINDSAYGELLKDGVREGTDFGYAINKTRLHFMEYP